MNKIIKKHIPHIFLIVIFSAMYSAMNVFVAVLLQNIVDCATEHNVKKFLFIVLFSFIYVVLLCVIYFSYRLLIDRFKRNIVCELRIRIFQGVINSNYENFQKNDTGEYISMLTNDIRQIEENYISPLISILQNSFVFIGTFSLLFYYDKIITLILCLLLIASMVLPKIISKFMQNMQLQLSKQNALFIAQSKNFFSGFDIITTFGLNRIISSKFNTENNQLSLVSYNLNKIISASDATSCFFSCFIQFTILITGTYLIMIGKLSLGVSVALIQIASMFTSPISTIIQYFSILKSSYPIRKKIDCFINNESFQDEVNNEKIEFKSISLQNISFAYETEKTIIRDFSFSFFAKKKYAIIGKSGCGKSTIIKLLSSYYSNYQGEILFNNHGIKSISPQTIVKTISVIHQNVYLFTDTIKENICLYRPYTDCDFMRTLDMSGLTDFIKTLKNQEYELITENGKNLSGGQRQRISLARAIIRAPQLLLLDEGTASLDKDTGKDIEKRLLKNNDLALITITHNLSEDLLSLYDEIIYMENGSIIENGSFEDLLQRNGSFKEYFLLNN